MNQFFQVTKGQKKDEKLNDLVHEQKEKIRVTKMKRKNKRKKKVEKENNKMTHDEKVRNKARKDEETDYSYELVPFNSTEKKRYEYLPL